MAGNFQQRDQSGALFKNDRKTEDRHPDYTGTCMVNGVEMWMSAWIKRSQAGKTFMSMAFNPKNEPVSTRTVGEDMSDEIPF